MASAGARNASRDLEDGGRPLLPSHPVEMTGPVLTIAIAFMSLEVARRALEIVRERTRAEAQVAPLGSLEYGVAHPAAFVAARVPMRDVYRVRELADELGGRVLEEREITEDEG